MPSKDERWRHGDIERTETPYEKGETILAPETDAPADFGASDAIREPESEGEGPKRWQDDDMEREEIT